MVNDARRRTMGYTEFTIKWTFWWSWSITSLIPFFSKKKFQVYFSHLSISMGVISDSGSILAALRSIYCYRIEYYYFFLHPLLVWTARCRNGALNRVYPSGSLPLGWPLFVVLRVARVSDSADCPLDHIRNTFFPFNFWKQTGLLLIDLLAQVFFYNLNQLEWIF